MCPDAENSKSFDLFLSARKHTKISIIVPVYNEGTQILGNLNLLLQEVEPYFDDFEVIVVSDGSTDETNHQLKQFQHPKIRSILLDHNRGKGYAIRRGFFEAKGEYILFIDGGMELHPREIRFFFGLLSLYDADLVIGSKRHPQSQVEYPWARKILSLIYQFLIMFFFDLDVTDTQVGMKLFKRQVVEAIRDDLSVDRYGMDLELLALAKMRGFSNMLEAPIRMDYLGKSGRTGIQEYFHILKVGTHVLTDTFKVYLKLKRLRRQTA